jgi:Tol biopolymer transport system component
VVFDTSASNLPGGSGTYDQSYVHDRRTGRTRLVTRNNQGDPADKHSDAAGISGNGRYVTFNSRADNMPGANPVTDHYLVYVRDLQTSKTRLISKTTGGEPADDYSYYGHPSSSGRYITFESSAGNLPGENFQIYLHDRRTGRTSLVSRANDGDPADSGGSYASISLDGRVAAFYSSANNLPGGGSTDQPLVYARGPLQS